MTIRLKCEHCEYELSKHFQTCPECGSVAYHEVYDDEEI